jgi:hypothetical protein
MQTHDVLKGDGDQGIGIIFLEVLGRRKRQPLQVFEAPDVLRFDARFGKFCYGEGFS